MGEPHPSRSTGLVQDSARTVIAGAQVTLTNAGTGQTRRTTTDSTGTYTITDLLPGTYNLSISLPGFKTHGQAGVVVTATERAVMRPVTLEIGEPGQFPPPHPRLRQYRLYRVRQLVELPLRADARARDLTTPPART